jgi:hypothetical protein
VDERVWRLPGPRGFVRDVVAEHRRGRHVATVLPQALASDVIFTDSLGVALLEEFASQSVTARRIYGAGRDNSVLETFSQALIFDDQPATVSELLNHPEVKDTVAVVVAGDLSVPARAELSSFLQRVELETHAETPTRRLSMVAILERGQLPSFRGGTSSDIAMTSIWWWARLARWDVAAHIAGLGGHPGLNGVVEDIRVESIVEVARWDLDLAERLVVAWAGEPSHLAALLKEGHVMPTPTIDDSHLVMDALRPPDSILESWDNRLVDVWHNHQSIAACALAAEPDKLNRMVWAAQARVLLPWIEERRSTLHARVAKTVGAKRLAWVLRNRFDPPINPDTLVEIGALDRVVRMIIGSRDGELRDASRRLREARNALAHLRPLNLAEQEGLQAACQCLL